MSAWVLILDALMVEYRTNERRSIFPYLTVRQNLLLGAYHPAARARRDDTLADVEALFPRLRARSVWQRSASAITAPSRGASARGSLSR